ncbi:MAG: hypothetical protein NC213_05470 [Acetobacter sp.]|nr:hypothetical protein [Bacteroides sp.]MCM1341176.1 hypothetical protein [Acetobacter sp.]MCM1433490.1 hypothetical protein [Clostridiales bacterium]
MVKVCKAKIFDCVLLTVMLGTALVLILFSAEAKEGAVLGLALAENTIIPSLLPLLIIFLTIMKTGAGTVLSRIFGAVTVKIFNLPAVASSTLIFGLIGGYPTGALITNELLRNDNIDARQARRILRFNFCGGCGFIITAVGTITYGSISIGLILFASNVISAVVIGILLSFKEKRIENEYFSYDEAVPFSEALSSSVSSAVSSVLSIAAYVIVFSALKSIVDIPNVLMPAAEITNGVCTEKFDLPLLSAYLAFGGFCIHFQLLGIISKAGMKYADFLLFRVISALLSYGVTKIILLAFPIDKMVFANGSVQTVSFSSVNVTLSVLMIIGCFVLILDINSKRRFKNNI